MESRSHALIDLAAITLVAVAVLAFTMAVAFGWIMLGQ
jgi:hypothetical protein